MNKTVIALTTGLLLASGASAFAASTALDVQDVPPRGASQTLLPTFGLAGDATSAYDEFSAENGFGDHAPTFENGRSAGGIDYSPTGSIGDVAEQESIYSPQNGWGDHGDVY